MVLALPSVSSFVSSASPPAALENLTWMSGCSLFQTATILSMFGTQDRKVRVTFWFAVAAGPDEPPDEQPAAKAIAAMPQAAGATARESFIAAPRGFGRGRKWRYSGADPGWGMHCTWRGR